MHRPHRDVRDVAALRDRALEKAESVTIERDQVLPRIAPGRRRRKLQFQRSSNVSVAHLDS